VLILDDGHTKTPIDRTVRITCDGELRAVLVGDLIRRVAGHHGRRVIGVWPAVPGAEEFNVRGPDPTPAHDGAIHITTGACTLASHDGLDPLAVRLALLERHYRADVSLTRDDLEAAAAALTAQRRGIAEWAENPGKPPDPTYVSEAIAALDQDLDTPKALKILNRLAEDPRVPPGAKFETTIKLDMILGLDLVALVGRI
jgi:hypothetical protein